MRWVLAGQSDADGKEIGEKARLAVSEDLANHHGTKADSLTLANPTLRMFSQTAPLIQAGKKDV